MPDPIDRERHARMAASLRDALARLGLSPDEAARRWGLDRRTMERLCADHRDRPITQRLLAAALADAELRQVVAGPEECPDLRAALRPHLVRLADAAARAGWDPDEVGRALRGEIGDETP